MGTEVEARALAAGDVISVNGKEYILRPVVAQHLADLEREALKAYKRDYLETFFENQDLLPESMRESIVHTEMQKVAQWDTSHLPQKTAYDVSRVPVTEKVKEWITENHGELPDNENGMKAVLVYSLDTGKLTPETLRELAGKGPIQGRVRYDQWWVTACVSGQIAFIYSSVRMDQKEITKQDVANWPLLKIIEAAHTVEAITSIAMGNT
jgi:hypothetical protein